MSPRFILVCCWLIHTQTLVRNGWHLIGAHNTLLPLLNIFQGLTFLFYPISGWMAEVCFTSIQMVRWSFLITIFGFLLMAMNGTAILWEHDKTLSETVFTITSIASVIIVSMGLGMFEANAIQAAMEEMIDKSSEQLSSFIHWFFWCSNFASIIVLYFMVGSVIYSFQCHISEDNLQYYSGIGVLLLSALQIPFHFFGFIFTKTTQNPKPYNQLAKRNSLTIIYKVLKYSYQHKYPERRSAFTYWENDIPSRIDLGKDKYGGPFTYEQVEDVKTFFRLLVLIVSLFGFHLMGDGYSLSNYIMKMFGCPTALPFGLILGNPQHFPFLVAVIGIPLYQCVRRRVHHFLPNMLTTLWFGLLFSLVSQTLQMFHTALLDQTEYDFQCPKIENLSLGNSINMKCLYANMQLHTNNGCMWFCLSEPINRNLYVIYLSIIVWSMSGISYVMIFMTMLEFICAQSPNSLKGLLIGIWYSMQAIKYTVNTFDTYPQLLEFVSWNTYNGAKGIGMFLSIVLFSVAAKNYRYRERNEIVNEQAIIEEQYERELLINESDDIDSTTDEHSPYK